MPYNVGEKGSYGCSGYPVVKEGGEVMGCHETREDALAQQRALYANENKVNKSEFMGSDKDPVTGEEREDVIDDSDLSVGWSGMFKPVVPQMNKAKDKYDNIIKPRKGSPANKELYARIVAEAKRKFDVYPSAVANAWVVAEYKRRGGKYNSK